MNYLVKLNSKTDLVKKGQSDPVSLAINTVDDVLDHILPEDWREERHDVVAHTEVSSG